MSKFSYHRGWGELSTQDQSDLIAFWLEHKALPNEAQGRQRVAQVVMFARDPEGKVAAVCTAVPQNPPQLGQPVYFYRSFVAPEWRQTLVVFRLLKQAVALLEEDARAHDWPCIGVLLELENQRFGEKGRMPNWPGIDFVYVGKSPRGLECRIHWFKEAKLKG
ncbi:hypothetical protein [Wenzhouxiangella marina]|uniref:Uncharacterized protein n=1 Tax=Wenzhouxiangella marina TaxID=1579979 RepID=A0A0K0XZ43_9GAMM|nr:hypothetical protein [Wenzhouxiangella marina]AKS42902.1 hypothetical protein WM2015_2544 [Wenzhouxiangella marina]MBB6087415.1 hypothetical protein [Wenzhouxiangella marina]